MPATNKHRAESPRDKNQNRDRERNRDKNEKRDRSRSHHRHSPTRRDRDYKKEKENTSHQSSHSHTSKNVFTSTTRSGRNDEMNMSKKTASAHERDNQITSESKIPNKHSTEYRHRHLRSDINDKAGDKSSNNRSENKREIIKRARSKSPPIQSKRHRDDKSPEKKQSERTAKPAFISDTFGDNQNKSDAELNHSGFANKGFSNSSFGNLGFDKLNRNTNTNDKQRHDYQGKPRIMAPENSLGEGGQKEFIQSQPSKMIIVNELSAESIKREENPMKGTRPTRRQNVRRGDDTSVFVGNRMQRGGRGGNSYGANRNQTIGLGTRGGWSRFEGSNATESGKRRVIVQMSGTDRAIKEPTAEFDEPPLNPFAVPRGRNYFLHDHRDSVTASDRLYDPRLDRHDPPPPRDGRSISGRRDRRGGIAGAPMGWRNLDDQNKTQEPVGPFSRVSRSRNVISGIEQNRAADGSRALYWNSKAEQDIVWKHDKYVEISQEETKLELLDEVEVDANQQVKQEEKYTYQPVAEVRQRYQEDEDYLDYGL